MATNDEPKARFSKELAGYVGESPKERNPTCDTCMWSRDKATRCAITIPSEIHPKGCCDFWNEPDPEKRQEERSRAIFADKGNVYLTAKEPRPVVKEEGGDSEPPLLASGTALSKLQAYLLKGQPPRQGLVPQSGDWNAPDRWVRLEDAATKDTRQSIASGKNLLGAANPNFDKEAYDYQLGVLERSVKSQRWGTSEGGSNVRFRLENLGDALREIVGNGAEDYIEEKLDRVEHSLKDSEWKAPVDEQSQGMLVLMQLQLEKFPAKSERAKLARQLMMAGVRRDTEKIRLLIGKVREEAKLEKQEGGLSGGGTVAVSSDPGVFTPTYGGHGKKKLPISALGKLREHVEIRKHLLGHHDQKDHGKESDVLESKIWSEIKRADKELPDKAGRAISSFVAGEAEPLSEVGIMSSERLEEAFSDTPTSEGKVVREQLERAFAPIKAQLKQEFGDSIRLYRYQTPIPEGSSKRNILSWTADKEFAEALRGSESYTTYTIRDKHGDYPEIRQDLGAIPFKSREAAERWLQQHGGKDIHGQEIEVPEVEEETTKIPRRGEIREREVDLNDVVWVTDRKNQKEFIVRTTGDNTGLEKAAISKLLEWAELEKAHVDIVWQEEVKSSSVLGKSTAEKFQRWLQKLQPPRQGLVPKSGDWEHPDHWVRPDSLEQIRALARQRKLAIPPAWTEVRFSADPKSPLQAVGKDAKGRLQYLYSKKHSEKAAAEKFARAKAFIAKYPSLQERLAKDAPRREEAAVLYLVDKTAFRIGKDTDTKAAQKAYGATTLLGKHVKVDGDTVSFSFVGKKGVPVDKKVTDPLLAKIVKERVKGENDKLFSADEGQVARYLKGVAGKKFMPKDFRTLHGTMTAMQEMKKLPVPKTKREFQHNVKEVATAVAKWLGNTPAIALKAYISPIVFSSWEAALARAA